MRWCPKCHHPAEAGSRFCSRCGEVLPYFRCASCGTANEVDAWRCVECGRSLHATAAAAPQPAPADEPTLALGPLARLAELRSSPASRPAQDAPVHAAVPAPGHATGHATGHPPATPGAGPMSAPPVPASMPAPVPASMPAPVPAPVPVPASASASTTQSAAARPDFGETAPAILATEALRAAHAIVPHEPGPPAPAVPPGLRWPTAPAPTMPPHLAATIASIARVVAETPAAASAAPPAPPAMPAIPPYAATAALLPPGDPSAQGPSWRPAPVGAPPAADAVDLYLDVPAPAVMQVDIPLGVEPGPAFVAHPFGEASTAPGMPAGGFAHGRWAGLKRPLMVGAAAGLVLAVLVGLVLHWQRLNNPDSGTQATRPLADEAEPRRSAATPSATLGRDLPPRPAALPPDAARRALPPAGAAASAAARRGPGVDAAADAALEAAERLLATRPAPPGPGASAPRPARPGGG